MSDALESVWKSLFWLLFVVLVGLSVLASHRIDSLQARIAVASETGAAHSAVSTHPTRGSADSEDVAVTQPDSERSPDEAPVGVESAPAAATTVTTVTNGDRSAFDDAAENNADAAQAIAKLKARLTAQGQANAQLRAARDQAIAQQRAVQARADAALQVALSQARQATTELHGFYSGLAELGAHLTEQGIRLTLAGDALRFPSGSATLPEGEVPVLDRIATLLRQRPRLNARIEGHTDSSGSGELNRRLSEQRAAAVRDRLIKQGITAERLSSLGVGAERPVADDATAAGRRANRRVEVWIITPSEG